MKKFHKTASVICLVLGFFILGCDEDAECADCGSKLEHYFRLVTEEDFASFATVDGIKVDACMRWKVAAGLKAESISIVDDCCCN